MPKSPSTPKRCVCTSLSGSPNAAFFSSALTLFALCAPAAPQGMLRGQGRRRHKHLCLSAGARKPHLPSQVHPARLPQLAHPRLYCCALFWREKLCTPAGHASAFHKAEGPRPGRTCHPDCGGQQVLRWLASQKSASHSCTIIKMASCQSRLCT